ncbi:hypothetical protein [Lysobacter sp. CA199]|uniref:hypothetical protein n=1 Tax=Lysobacter sp. CA199 TaxID=3455608 RepID=UPI003F8CF6B2
MIALKVWMTTVLAALAAVLAAFGWGRWRGTRRARKAADERVASSEHRAAVAEQVSANTEVRTEVETDVMHFPSSDDGAVADTVPGSAADRLHDSWSRD